MLTDVNDELTGTCSPESGCRLPSDSTAASVVQPAPEHGTPTTLKLDIVSDTICPWCYVGKRKIAGALEILGREGLTFDVAWRPFQLNPDMPKNDLDRREYRSAKFGSWERCLALDAQVTAAGQTVGLVRKVLLVGTAPQGGEEHLMEVLKEAQSHKEAPDPRLPLFFTPSGASQAADLAFLKRASARTVDRDPDSGDAIMAQQAKALIGWCAAKDPATKILWGRAPRRREKEAEV